MPTKGAYGKARHAVREIVNALLHDPPPHT
jgi:hypothetical protein